jgi:chromosome segregation ATPase
MRTRKKDIRKVSRSDGKLALDSRLSDLESFVSDTAAHLADLEARYEALKRSTNKTLVNRVSDLESHVSDAMAHLADLESRMKRLKTRVKSLL